MIIKKIAGIFLGTSLTLLPGAIQAKKKNILFISVDDLRPELGCYGHPLIHSPNIDRLAKSGVLFTRSYCNVPVCGASRASIMSGVRPGVNRFVKAPTSLDEHLPGVVSLPMHFKNNGYSTISLGKVFHHQFDGKGSWDMNWRPGQASGRSWRDYQLEENLALDKGLRSPGGLPYENADVPDEAYSDGMIATKAIDELKAHSKSGQPFFMAVGFMKPHLPFNAPSKYWELYPEEVIKLPYYMQKPINAPDQAMHNFGELRNYAGIPAKGSLSEEMALKLIHGYYACVSYIDAQVGKVLEALEESGMAENTIVVLWGDHGWHLGEHGLWAKHCNFEKVLHTPLIIRSPGHKAGIVSEKLVELVDVYPTLCELAGLVNPFHLQGNSLVPLLDGGKPVWKDAVFSRWMRGETVITQTHTYTEWFENEKTVARMLYDLRIDVEETINISENEENKALVKELHNRIVKHVTEREQINLPAELINK